MIIELVEVTVVVVIVGFGGHIYTCIRRLQLFWYWVTVVIIWG